MVDVDKARVGGYNSFAVTNCDRKLEVTVCDFKVERMPCAMPDIIQLIPDVLPQPEPLEQLIFILRNQRVMLSPHLASLYGVLPKALVQAVKRNPERFPEDFMFQLTDAEYSEFEITNCDLKSRRVRTSLMPSRSRGWRCCPASCGVPAPSPSMSRSCGPLSACGGCWPGMPNWPSGLTRFRRKLSARFQQTDEQFQRVFDAIRELIAPTESRQARMGFRESPEKNLPAP